MKIKKGLVVILASALLVTFVAACGDSAADDNNSTTTSNNGDTTTADAENGIQERSLGGKKIIIGNWWANSDDGVIETSYQEARLAYREEIQTKYNCTIKEVNLCNWDQMQELASASIVAQGPEADIFTLDSGWAGSLLRQNLLYDVASLPSADLSAEKWNKLVHEVMTFGDRTYGFATTYEPRSGVFWNKRLFEEAGLERDEPYDLQAAGTWTWDEFSRMLKATTIDNNNDGIIDTYGLATFSKDLFNGWLYSNNAKFVGKNEIGEFYNATNDPEFLQVCEFLRKINDDGYVMPQPEGTNWDWFKAAFKDGQAAMRIAEEYSKGEMKDMADDFGFVLIPGGPNGEMTPTYRENVLIIPGNNCFTEEQADDIFFAYDMWSEKIPGYEDDDSWKITAYTEYRDERAVDETLTIMRKGEDGVLILSAYVPGLDTGDITYNIWNNEKTPAELIEGVQQTWNAVLEDVNKRQRPTE